MWAILQDPSKEEYVDQYQRRMWQRMKGSAYINEIRLAKIWCKQRRLEFRSFAVKLGLRRIPPMGHNVAANLT